MRLEEVPQKDDLNYRDYLVEVEKFFVTIPKLTATTDGEFGPPLPSDEEIRAGGSIKA